MGFFIVLIILFSYNFFMAYDEISKALTVSEANKLIKATLNESFYQIMIVGEISGFRPSTPGHWYFDLKDKESSISAAVFKSMQYNMPKVQNGDVVVAIGRIDIYEKSGKLTFIISRMVRQGDGELQALIEKRKQYYQSLGWFDIDRKKKLPDEIRKVGIVTSATGAAIKDILNITKRRAPSLDLILFPCVVQGDGAAVTIASRIRQANNFGACDVLIVGRGGGSQEDLSCFSTDEVIEAIYESEIPVISAVGHEIDYPLSDYVADLRAPTPSAAAEIVTAGIFSRKERLESVEKDISFYFSNILKDVQNRMRAIEDINRICENKFLVAKSKMPKPNELEDKLRRKLDNAIFRVSMAEDANYLNMKHALEKNANFIQNAKKDIANSMAIKTKEAKKSLDMVKINLNHAIKERVNASEVTLNLLKKETEALSPISVLERGFAVVQDKNGRIVKSTKNLKSGDELTTRLYKGEFTSIVKEKNI